MRILILFFSLLLIFIVDCRAQENHFVNYIGQRYNSTKNKSFINNELIFLKNKDTLRINVKLPYDADQHQIIDKGIYYDCHLKKDIVYTITLKKICIDDVPNEYNSYYKINAISDKKECSKFKEIERNTGYLYKGNYGKYVDMNNVLYEIIGLSPGNGYNHKTLFYL